MEIDPMENELDYPAIENNNQIMDIIQQIKRNKSADKLFSMDKLKPKDFDGLREYIKDLESRLKASQLVRKMNR